MGTLSARARFITRIGEVTVTSKKSLKLLLDAALGGSNPSAAPSESDAALLERFAQSRHEPSFRLLVERYSALVWGVCWRMLRHRQDSEDAFQATFLVLARRAGDIARRESLPAWLHGVARKTSMNVQRATSRRDERQVDEMPETATPPHPSDPDLGRVIDEELSHLPARVRDPLVLCLMQGLNYH